MKTINVSGMHVSGDTIPIASQSGHVPENFTAAAIVVAAGSSSRFGGEVRKPYLKLQGKPILAWTLSALAKVRGLKQLVIVIRPEDRKPAEAAVAAAQLPKGFKPKFAEGGPRRQDSVLNGLKATDPKLDLVLIHDAARPFPPQAAMRNGCLEALQTGAAILAVRVKDTVKRQGMQVLLQQPAATPEEAEAADTEETELLIETTVPRTGLWLAQTPQIFRRKLIMKLFERLEREAPYQEITDDAGLCEFFQEPVALIPSSDINLKITRPEDLPLAEACLKLAQFPGT
jgi:2-C-methyl-D-erythritol 4-phosphate cytidylyltransferase